MIIKNIFNFDKNENNNMGIVSKHNKRGHCAEDVWLANKHMKRCSASLLSHFSHVRLYVTP